MAKLSLDLECYFFEKEGSWLPAKISNHPMELNQVQGAINAGHPWLRRIEVITRPIVSYICTSLPRRLLSASVLIVLLVGGTSLLDRLKGGSKNGFPRSRQISNFLHLSTHRWHRL